MWNANVYRLTDGIVSKCPIATWGLPAALKDRVTVEAGDISQHVLAALPAAASIIQRVAPWARAYAAPYLQARCDGEDALSYRGGVHRWRDAEDIIILSLGSGDEETLLNAAFHESWHAVERFLAPHCESILTAAADQGHAYAEPYLGKPVERLARGFASWCMSRLEFPPAPGWVPSTSVERMWSQVESGEFAQMVLGDRKAA